MGFQSQQNIRAERTFGDRAEANPLVVYFPTVGGIKIDFIGPRLSDRNYEDKQGGKPEDLFHSLFPFWDRSGQGGDTVKYRKEDFFPTLSPERNPQISGNYFLLQTFRFLPAF